MAALDWATVVADLTTAKQGTDYAEAEMADELVVELTTIGTPYDAAYTSQADTQKAADEASFSSSLATWEVDTEAIHDQTMKLIRYVENLLSLDASPEVTWSSNVSILASNKVLIVNRLGQYSSVALAASGSGNASADGLSELIVRASGKFETAYDSRPVLSYTGAYGEERSVIIPNVGQVTIAKAEELLQAFMDESAQLIADISYTP